MIIHESLLKKYFSSSDYNLSDYENLINDHIMEVERLEILSKNTHLIIGEILEFHKISQKKKINFVKVNIGAKILSIVCAASNLETNKKVVVALLGSYLEKKKMYIVEKEFDNIKSQGMICSAEELGLPLDILTFEEKEGILFLDAEAPLGTCALEYLGLKGFLLKIALTPDRSDLLSHAGFAKDFKAVLDDSSIYFKEPIFPFVEESEKVNSFEIKISSENCLEYHIRYLENIEVDISPLWLRNLLSIYNIEPVNNVIDVLNLILIEDGIPLDAFDTFSLQKDMIIIRNAYPEEKIAITKEKKKDFFLTPNDLVITDNQDRLISIAGIINMPEYIVNKKTKNIVITSAYFQPQNILKTSKKMNLKNEKILRLTRGIDISLLKQALEKATFLLQKISQAKVTKKIISVQKKKYKNIAINLTLEFIRSKTDIDFKMETIERFLHRLDYQIISISEDSLTVLAPLRRHDIKIKEDIISDLIRLYGYNQIESYKTIVPKLNTKTERQKTLDELRNLISSLGFFEIITYSLISEKIFNLFTESKNYLEIINPLSHERVILRHHLSVFLKLLLIV
ncbi:phenylalanine--tRNA ligase subunit beta [Candidatus Phytoplasma pini]|uniref:Phenylalanine--tRNA ligase beta subunit n=1 Tax=Candidatus Phytoplasma pini TaxID=267362 RepID=A0A559KJ20_9MOLU|nr:phenylalanine--tRNA ligase subunit beta [Candidatus Phytoplasma pini]TVY12107.1 Phenylalanyl-tRNA synthetase beta chain [Candidatus Phytoplasma pini]